MIAGADFCDGAADGFYNAGTFMAEHDGQGRRQHAVADHEVRVAHAGGHDFYENFVGARRLDLDGLDHEWSAGFSGNRCLDFHNFPPAIV